MTLYELEGAALQLYALFDDPEADADAILDTFDSLMPDIKEKLVGYMLVIKNVDAEADAIAREIEKLRGRKSAKDNAVARMKERMISLMSASGLTKVEDPKGTITLRKPTQVADIDDDFLEWAKSNRDDLLKYREPEVNKEAVKRELKAGKSFEHARLTDGKQSIVMK